jgi:hypothetical protein
MTEATWNLNFEKWNKGDCPWPGPWPLGMGALGYEEIMMLGYELKAERVLRERGNKEAQSSGSKGVSIDVRLKEKYITCSLCISAANSGAKKTVRGFEIEAPLCSWPHMNLVDEQAHIYEGEADVDIPIAGEGVIFIPQAMKLDAGETFCREYSIAYRPQSKLNNPYRSVFCCFRVRAVFKEGCSKETASAWSPYYVCPIYPGITYELLRCDEPLLYGDYAWDPKRRETNYEQRMRSVFLRLGNPAGRFFEAGSVPYPS